MDGWIPLEGNVTSLGKSGRDYTLAPEEILPCVYSVTTLFTRMKSENYIVIVPVRTKEKIVNTLKLGKFLGHLQGDYLEWVE